MPLGLSTPRTDATTDIAESPPPAKEAQGIPTFFEVDFGIPGATEAIAKTSTFVGNPQYTEPEVLAGITLQAPTPSEQLTWIESPLEGEIHSSRTIQMGESRDIGIRIPRMEWPVGQDPVLTSSVRGLLGALWAIVVSRALQGGFPLQKTTVSVFEDPTEQERKAVLRLACSVNAAQALAFWDSLEPDLQSWLDTLRENDRTTFHTKIA